MAKPRTQETHAAPNITGAESGDDDDALIANVSAARQAGSEDPEGVEELLRRAAARNRAALDRLAR